MKLFIACLAVALSATSVSAQSITPLSQPITPSSSEGNCLYCITPYSQPEGELTEDGAELQADLLYSTFIIPSADGFAKVIYSK
jgi:hypothetical protein